jgi:hypothetical protein
MATKNRLATPKMLTTPRSTGESSSRPSEEEQVTEGQVTPGPQSTRACASLGTYFLGWVWRKRAGAPHLRPPPRLLSCPTSGSAPSPTPKDPGGPSGPQARLQPGRVSRAPAGAGGCAVRSVPTGEGAGIRHPEPGLPKAGRRGSGGVRRAGACRLCTLAGTKSPCVTRDRNPSLPGSQSPRAGVARPGPLCVSWKRQLLLSVPNPVRAPAPLTVARVRVHAADAAVGEHLKVEANAHVAVESPQTLDAQQVVTRAALDCRLFGLRGHRQTRQRARHQALPAALQLGLQRVVGCGGRGGDPSACPGRQQGQQDRREQRHRGSPGPRHPGPRAVRASVRRSVRPGSREPSCAWGGPRERTAWARAEVPEVAREQPEASERSWGADPMRAAWSGGQRRRTHGWN